MNPFRSPTPSDDRDLAAAAARWVLRCDRGLTPEEQDELSLWLAEPAHREAFAAERWSWDELDRIAGLHASLALPNPDLVGPAAPIPTRAPWYRRPRHWAAVGALAASLAVGFYVSRPEPEPVEAPVPVATALAAPLERRLLEDGSRIDCNRGARVAVSYTSERRQVRLLRGEANFTVAKDPSRPFYVTVGDVTFRAVGTEFNVRMDAHVVELVVREGWVEIGSVPSAEMEAEEPARPLLGARQRAVIPHTPTAAPLVSTLSAEDLEARLSWQPRLLDFNDTPLRDIVAAFNRHNVLRVAIRDPKLEALCLSATFRSDNVEGFLRLLASEFGVRVEWRHEREVVLHAVE